MGGVTGNATAEHPSRAGNRPWASGWPIRGEGNSPRVAVDDLTVAATLPHLPPVVRDMVQVQRLTGCRPGKPRGHSCGHCLWRRSPGDHSRLAPESTAARGGDGDSTEVWTGGCPSGVGALQGRRDSSLCGTRHEPGRRSCEEDRIAFQRSTMPINSPSNSMRCCCVLPSGSAMAKDRRCGSPSW
jgi:hypothetical protein